MERETRLKYLEPYLTGFLPPVYDAFILGAAYRAAQPPKPVYSFNAAVAYTKDVGMGPLVAHRFLNGLEYGKSFPAPLVLHSFSRRATDSLLKKLRLPMWDPILGSAAMGFSTTAGGRDIVLCYSYAAAITALLESQLFSDSHDPRFEATEYLETRLLPVDMGPLTPYLVRCI